MRGRARVGVVYRLEPASLPDLSNVLDHYLVSKNELIRRILYGTFSWPIADAAKLEVGQARVRLQIAKDQVVIQLFRALVALGERPRLEVHYGK